MWHIKIIEKVLHKVLYKVYVESYICPTIGQQSPTFVQFYVVFK